MTKDQADRGRHALAPLRFSGVRLIERSAAIGIDLVMVLF